MELWDCNRAARSPQKACWLPVACAKRTPRHSVGIISAAQRLFSLIRTAPPACLATLPLRAFRRRAS